MSNNTQRSKRRSSSEMYPLVSAWLSSGESQQDFCQHHDLSVGTFGYWVGKYRREQDAVPTVESRPFVPLLASGSERLCHGGQIRLIYGEVELAFGSGVEADFIAAVVQRLRG